MNNHHVIAIGTSAGGIQALRTVVQKLPQDFPGSIHIVQHLSNETPSNLTSVLAKVSKLPVAFAKDGEPIESGRIYLAPPDFHFVLELGRIRIIRGPRENRMRPAIDPLFRTAAVAYRSYATGVVLTGMLDDGTAGLQAIKACGGMAIVQDPNEAKYNSMPKSAIANVKVDRVVALDDIAEVLIERVKQKPAIVEEIPPDLLLEAPITVKAITDPTTMQQIGKPVAHACPSCGGPLWQLGNNGKTDKEYEDRDSLLRYRCHVGHAFTSRNLLEEQNKATEKALWIALRTLEERGRLLKQMSERYARGGSDALAKIHQERATEALESSTLVRDLIRNLRTLSEFSPKNDFN